MVEQVLLNLTRNAMQAMDEPGIAPRVLEVRVRVGRLQRHAALVEFLVA